MDKKAMTSPLFLQPVITHNIWGGERLRTDYGYDAVGSDLGECWGISAHPNGEGIIRSGIFAGKKLSELWTETPELFGNKGADGAAILPYDRFPLLIKIIDARDDLSIQVHPDDAYAAEHENGSFGKTECWYVLDCPADAKLVIGHNATTREELADWIHEGKWSELIREIPVKKGDFIQINPGTVHAIKGGLLILETQQNSDITYRVYDYDRLQNGKPRQLHVEQSIDVISVPAPSAEESVKHTAQPGCTGHCDGCLAESPILTVGGVEELYSCSYYTVSRAICMGELELDLDAPFTCVSVLQGEGELVVEGNGTANISDSVADNADGAYMIRKGDHFILPCDVMKVKFSGRLEMMLSHV